MKAKPSFFGFLVLAAFSWLAFAPQPVCAEAQGLNSVDADLPIGAAGQTVLWVKKDKNLLLRTASGAAQAKLDVDGSLRLAAETNTTCNADRAGVISLFKEGSSHVLKFCNGVTWVYLSCPDFGHGSIAFTSSATYTPPAGVSASCPLKIRVMIVGGGGYGGTGGNRGSWLGGAGGGGGSGNIQAAQIQLTSGAGVPVVVGGPSGTSSFSGYTAGGGGGGGNGGDGVYNAAANGGAGGSGGGGGGGGAAGCGTWSGMGGAGGPYGYSGRWGDKGGSHGSTLCGPYCGSFGNPGGAQGSPSYVAGTTVLGVTFTTASFSLGSGGGSYACGPYACHCGVQGGFAGMGGAGGGGGYSGPGGTGYGAGGGGGGGAAGGGGGGGGAGGILINGVGLRGGDGATASSYSGGGGGAGASGIVYLEW